MAITFKERLELAPLPLNAYAAAVLARHEAAKVVAAGGVVAAARAAAEAVLARSPNAPPSERGRLQCLFAQVYTRAELEGLAAATYTSLGLRS